jgi:hypothetical protein
MSAAVVLPADRRRAATSFRDARVGTSYTPTLRSRRRGRLRLARASRTQSGGVVEKRDRVRFSPAEAYTSGPSMLTVRRAGETSPPSLSPNKRTIDRRTCQMTVWRVGVLILLVFDARWRRRWEGSRDIGI